MEWLTELGRRLRRLGRRKQWESDLEEEMRLHMDLRAAEKTAEGHLVSDAHGYAKGRFGNATMLREESRSVWGWAFWETLSQDMRYSLRTFAANKGFTAAAILSLTLGIGANTAIFSIVNAVMLRTLPVEDPKTLVEMQTGNIGSQQPIVTNPIWEAVRDSQQAFTGMLAYSQDRFDIADGGESHFSNGLWVSGDFFHVLGVPVLRGRIFTNEDDRHGGGVSGPVAVISYAFWQANFAGDPNVLGKTVSLNRHRFEIIGITPAWFRGMVVDQAFDVAIPIGCEPLLHTDLSALDQRSWWWLRVVGRLKPGETLLQAEARMKSIAPEVNRATVPDDWTASMQASFLKRTLTLKPASTGFSITEMMYRTALITLMCVVGLVLLIACANIANLLLARATARKREISIRLAIGASRARVIRQLVTESMLLAMFGAAGGMLFSVWGAKLLVRSLSTENNPLNMDLTPDLHVLAFTIAIAVLTGLLFGLTPALRATGMGPNQALKENARGAVHGEGRFTLGKALVTGQVALSLVLLTGAGLFIGTLRNYLTLDTGFNPHHVLLVSVTIPPDRIARPLRDPLFARILADVRAIPGVRSASGSMFLPISHSFWNQESAPDGYHAQPQEDDTMVYLNRISPGYFRTMETPMLMGRDFSDRDTLAGPKVIIVAESTARHFWGTANPIGKTIGLIGPSGKPAPHQVVGLVRDSKYQELDEKQLRIGYVPLTQHSEPDAEQSFEVRFEGSGEAVTPAIRAVIGAANKDAAMEFRTLDARISDALVQPRLVALLSSFFGLLALLLATIGLYGVFAYVAARRRGEIGIRMALGAAQGAVTWLVVRDVVFMLAGGVALGALVSFAAGRYVKSLLFGVDATNPWTFGIAAAVLCSAALLAAYVPARRAAKMDPMIALREE